MRADRAERAVIYIDVVRSSIDAARAACLAHCDERGYQVVATVRGDNTGRAWRDGVLAMLMSGTADVVVLSSRADLPKERRPRVEFADEVAQPGGPGRHRRRPRPRILDR